MWDERYGTPEFVYGTEPNDWVRENAPRFGWVEAVPREPWHWEYRPHQV